MNDYMLICGDLLPTRNNRDLFERGDAVELFGSDLVSLFERSVYSIANLEGPLSDEWKPINKSGIPLSAGTKTVLGIKSLGINGLSLANNHIMDQGEKGFENTVETLRKNGIDFWGAGSVLEKAKKPMIVDVSGKRIGIYSCAEYEFTIARNTKSGANPFDELNICDDIMDLRGRVDYVIVLYHGMKEYYRYPAPYVQKRCRKLIEKGADLILCQHSHCVGCHERFRNGKILYGQGNFCFCLSNNNDSKYGLIVKLDLDSFCVSYIVIQQQGNIIRMVDEKERELVISEFEKRSVEIRKEGYVEKKYIQFAKKQQWWYDSALLFGRYASIINRLHLNKLLVKALPLSQRMLILNLLRCEAHRDLYISALETYESIKGG